MRIERHFTSTLAAGLSVLAVMLFLVACQQTQQPTPAAAPAAENKPATSDVFVVFEGPWAIVPDPKDSNNVLAIAPKTKSHRPLGVVPANTILEAGVYDLSVPFKSSGAAPEVDKSILRADVDPQAVQRLLENRGERYVVRLPKPEAYIAETRYPSRVGSKYPPEASSERDYATAVALRYSVASRTGFSLAGTQDVGAAFKPLLLQLDTSSMRFTIDPAEINAHDECNIHARMAFHDLTRLLGLTLYVDFPGGPEGCRKKDPQLASAARAQLLRTSPFESIARLEGEDGLQPETAGISSDAVGRGIEAAFYFFHSDGGGCKAPIIVGGGG
jgi:hypothetical protein